MLIDTPIGKYFQRFLADQVIDKMDADEVRAIFSEKEIELIEEVGFVLSNEDCLFLTGASCFCASSPHTRNLYFLFFRSSIFDLQFSMRPTPQGLINLWLEDFHEFCEKLGGDTAEVMCHLLKEKADTRAINITLNSFKGSLNDANQRQGDRKDLYPSLGYLYPEGTLRLEQVSDEDKLGAVFSEGSIVKYTTYNSACRLTMK